MDLVREFDKTGLRLELPRRPIVATNGDIFQMDIRRERGREWFRLWRGHEANEVRVADDDRRRRQLVLLVREPSRTFTERLRRMTLRKGLLDEAVEKGEARILKETEVEVVVERRTPDTLRRFLCGMDERHLFVAQVPGGTTVRDAHRLLKPREVRALERSGAPGILRQGEWFFAPLSEDEAGRLAVELRRSPYRVRRSSSLGGNGRPHIAAELVLLGDTVYARGSVRHPDHKTLVLEGWRRVYRNAEVRQSNLGSNGIYWID